MTPESSATHSHDGDSEASPDSPLTPNRRLSFQADKETSTAKKAANHKKETKETTTAGGIVVDDTEDDGIFYQVKAIVGRKTIKRKVYYLVQWEGCQEETWEPASNLSDTAYAEAKEYDASTKSTKKRRRKTNGGRKATKKRKAAVNDTTEEEKDGDEEKGKEENKDTEGNDTEEKQGSLEDGGTPQTETTTDVDESITNASTSVEEKESFLTVLEPEINDDSETSGKGPESLVVKPEGMDILATQPATVPVSEEKTD